jgi:hypothetical protein
VAKQRRRADRATNGALRGWLIKSGQGYYTGNRRSDLERWTAFPQRAKVYHRQGWAQKVAGQVIAVPGPAHAAPTELNRLPFTSNDGVSDGKR